MCYRTGVYAVCRHVHASLSPEILQALAVKGLICPDDQRDKHIYCLIKRRSGKEREGGAAYIAYMPVLTDQEKLRETDRKTDAWLLQSASMRCVI